MEIDLKVAAGQHYEVRVNGKLVCEGMGETANDGAWSREAIRKARTLCTMPHVLMGAMERLRTIHNIEDHINTSPDKKREAYCEGLAAGYANVTVPHPMSTGVPPMAPKYSTAYSQGYDAGEAIRRCVEATKSVGTSD